MTDWVARAAQRQVERKISAVIDSVDAAGQDAPLELVIAAALREVVNQCQNGMGVIYASDIVFLARKLEALAND
jgi:hypothetical protein